MPEEVAADLGVTPQAVRARRPRDTILAVPMPNGEWRMGISCVQFGEHGRTTGIDVFVRAFRDADAWTHLAVLLALSARYGGKRPLNLLEEGKVAEARSIAAIYGEQG